MTAVYHSVDQMLEKRGVDYLGDNSPLVHRDLHNVTRTDAELKYVRECSSPPGAHNLHFYRVRKKKTDKVCNTWLAICARGVEVYEVSRMSVVSALFSKYRSSAVYILVLTLFELSVWRRTRSVGCLFCLLSKYRSPAVYILVHIV